MSFVGLPQWIHLNVPLRGGGIDSETPFTRERYTESFANDFLDVERLSGYRLDWTVNAESTPIRCAAACFARCRRVCV